LLGVGGAPGASPLGVNKTHERVRPGIELTAAFKGIL
jgi:hypothetical protein